MMLSTHVLVDLAVATQLLVIAPGLAPTGLASALVGSVLPDLDLYVSHRKTLHYPTMYSVLSVGLLLVAALVPTPATVAAAFLLTGAAVHSRMDRYGCGLELRPWEETSERAVYDHVRVGWRRPLRWLRFDGATDDVLLLLLLGCPLLFLVEEPFRLVVLVAMLVGVTYGVIRRQLANLAPVVYGSVPCIVEAHVPDRYWE